MEDLTKLFQIGDEEHKGFLIKRDMQRLQGELSLSVDQLEAVFDSLDNDSQGYLTLDKFLLGYSKHRAGLKDVNSSDEIIINEKDLLIPNEISSYISDISNSMFVSKKTSDSFKELSQIIGDGELSPSWEKLLNSLREDMKKVQEHIVQLEQLITSRESQHDAYVRRLFEDMEVQLKEEKEKVLDEETNKMNAFRLQMEDELDRQQQEIRQLNKQNNDLMNKLRESVQQENRFKLLFKNLACDQEVYTNQIESLQKSTRELQNELEIMKAETISKYQEEYKRGYRTAQAKATFEEDSFIQQLRILRNMQSILSPDHIDQLTALYNFKKKPSV